MIESIESNLQVGHQRQVVRRHQRHAIARQRDLEDLDLAFVIDVIEVEDGEEAWVGATPAQVLAAFRADGGLFRSPERAGIDLIAASGADVLVESTPLQHGGQLAIAHIDAAFDCGLDIVTVNKGPIAWDYRRLRDRADAEGRRLRHEGVTMDGCPVYNLAEFCLPGDRVLGFRGVLNSTTNYVLDAMTEGASLQSAIAEAVDAGFAETDPSYDLEGHDAAAKVAALANVLLDADITPDAIPRDSIAELSQDDVAKVVAYGRRLRLIGEAQRIEDGDVTARVTLEPVHSHDTMYWISGTSSCLILETELAGTVEIVERNGLLTQTAYAVYADLLTIARSR